MNTTSIGRIGEDITAKYLEANGYEVIRRNFRASGGEIDIIAKKGAHLAFVEVKTRCNTDFGRASDAVNNPKMSRIKSAARAFLCSYSDYEDISFDVCEVYTGDRTINYIQCAFE